jgi:iron complex transport system substrate-binding protein
MGNLVHVVMLLAVSSAALGSPVTAVDDAGRQVRLEAPAQRIVSLAPHVTELLFAAGAGDHVVGVSEHSDYPPRAARLPRVGGGAGLDLEAIVGLRPDLVVAWQSGNAPGQLTRLERLGLALFYSEPEELDAIASSLERLGTLAGTREAAHRAAEEFREGVARLAALYAGRERVSVFYQIWERPLMTVSGHHMISAWLRLCGARNVFADASELAPAVSVEAVLAADPQVIIAGHYASRGEEWRQLWQAWPQLSAVAHGHLYSVPAEMMERQVPRALIAAQALCACIDRARDDRRGGEPVSVNRP